MRAHLGDQLVVESNRSEVTRREGEIVGLHHGDGTPPYDVRWSDTDEVAFVFPGPDAHVQHAPHTERSGRGASGATQVPAAPRLREV
ncbi:DUF1918 domain-containing protein [Streptomyces griseoaurantiacus]|uniref:DUF1918 domain-containing protein n=1 Tax=Streptomyces griseoaurantiacus TaxID=68213 RepID=UPI003790880A